MTFLYFVFPVLGGYIFASLYLLKNPQVLHKKKRSAFNCKHISHRGGCGERIESTMEAFHNAVDQGTHMLEMDCHLTRDGYVVVSHDENLKRQTGRDVNISSLDFQDLPLYKESLEVTFSKGEMSTGKDRKIPLLEDVFKAFPDMPISIEIKENNKQLITGVSNLVRKFKREETTVWASESDTIMRECCRTNDAMPRSFSMRRGILMLLLFYSGLLPFVSLGESLLQFYLPRIINRTYIPEDSRILQNQLVVFVLDKLTMRKCLFTHLAKRGIQVHLFVCNEDDDMQAAFDYGASGVMTDYPSRLSAFLSKKEKAGLLSNSLVTVSTADQP